MSASMAREGVIGKASQGMRPHFLAGASRCRGTWFRGDLTFLGGVPPAREEFAGRPMSSVVRSHTLTSYRSMRFGDEHLDILGPWLFPLASSRSTSHNRTPRQSVTLRNRVESIGFCELALRLAS